MSTDKLNAAIKRLLDIDPWDCTPDEINEAQEFMRIHMASHPSVALDQPPAAGPTDEQIADLAEVFNGDPVPAIRRALELWGSPAAAVLVEQGNSSASLTGSPAPAGGLVEQEAARQEERADV